MGDSRPSDDPRVIGARLEIAPGDPGLAVYLKKRPATLELFPRFVRAYARLETMGTDDDVTENLKAFEGILFNIVRLTILVHDRSEVETHRAFLGRLLSKFADRDFDWMWDRNLAAMAVLFSLRTEQTAQPKPTFGLFGKSSTAALLEAILAECVSRIDAGRQLPANLADRLRKLEGLGVHVNADVYPALAFSQTGEGA